MDKPKVLITEEFKSEPKIITFVRKLKDYPNKMPMRVDGETEGFVVFTENRFQKERNDLDERILNIGKTLYPILEKKEIYIDFSPFKFRPNDDPECYFLILYTDRDKEEAINILTDTIDNLDEIIDIKS